ncbi:MAG: LamG domain-containing protein [Verrucomicrobia bacterium]|nr:LamG domain-containing protein [Verrucomicrobiota bacterium]
MKNKWFAICLALLVSFNAYSQIMYADFEKHPTGNLTAFQNWSKYSTSATQPAYVTNDITYSGTKSMELPANFQDWHEWTQSQAVAHGFTYTNTGIHDGIIRMSTMLYVEKTNSDVRFELAWGFDKKLSARVRPYDGKLTLGSVGVSSVPVVTGRFARLTVYHDMNTLKSAMDYDDQRVIPWRNCGVTLSNRFNWFFFSRRDTNTSRVIVDDVGIECFPTGTWAHWRFEEGVGEKTTEHLGHIPTQSITNHFAGDWIPGGTDPVWTGTDDLLNEHGLSGYSSEIVHPFTNTPVMAEWTIEAIMKCEPGAWDGPTILRMGRLWIQGYYHGASLSLALGGGRPRIEARDSQEGDNTSIDWFITTNSMPFDNEWHHIAAVKQEEWIRLYIDHKPASAILPMSSVSSGTYQFTTNTLVFLGRIFGTNEAAREEHALDEVRLTARALDPTDFLQFGEPEIVGSPGQWQFNVTTIDGQEYYMQGTTNLTRFPWPLWDDMGSVTATDVVTTLNTGVGTDRLGYMRIKRVAHRPIH